MNEKLNLIDECERSRIEEDLEENFLVEAGAGSGKTTSLVNRFVALVASGRFEPGEIAAITFTRRAASELKEKIQLKMEEKAAEAASGAGEKSRALRKALDNLDRFFLGTIHSFCGRLLRERPVEFNVDPRFDQLDELAARQERNRAWENYLVRARTEKGDLVDRLLQTDLNPMQLKPAYNLLDSFPEVEVAVKEVKKPDLSSPVNSILNFVEEAINFIPSDEPEKGYDKLQKAVRQAWGYKEYTDLEREVNKFRLLKSFEGSLSVTLKRWHDREKAKSYRDKRAPALKENVVEPALRQWYRYRHKHAVEFLRPAVEEHRQRRREEAELNFQDLLHITARGLKDNPDLRRYFQNKYRALLVDEFQDTDPLQAEIIFYLTGRELDKQSWQDLNPHPGSLFLVGDPKQSIYRFRRADIDIYNLVKDRFRSGAGEVLNLTSNFRSLPAVTDTLNEVFKEILPAEESSYQAPYTPLNPVRLGDEDAISGVKVLNIPGDFTKKAEIVREDARRIATIIEDAVHGERKLAKSEPGLKDAKLENPEYRDFMIILRYKDMMEEYVKALKERDIPADVSGGSTLDRSTKEVRALHKLVKFLQDKNNPVLLAAVLRGLFYGISDDELYRFRSAGGELDLDGEIPQGLDEETSEKFKFAFTQLRRFIGLTEEQPPASALEEIVEELGLIPHLLAEKAGENRLSNIYYLLERLKTVEAERGIDFAGLVEEFDTVLEAGVEEELNLSYGTNAVRVMNLHKAKGLEAPVVFLAHPKKDTDHPPVRHIKREREEPIGYFRFCQEDSYGNKKTLALPPEWEKFAEEEEKYSQAEENRLLYVAATRARNLLVISDCTKKGNPWKPLLDSMPEQREIEVPEEIEKKEKDRERLGQKDTKSRGEVLGLRKSLQEWQKKVKPSSYRVTSATEIAGEEESEVIFAEEERAPEAEVNEGTLKAEQNGKTREEAMAFGTAAHNLVEKMIERRENIEVNDLEKLAEMAARESEMKEEHISGELDELIQIGNELKTSDLWKRICKSEMVKTEVPFSLAIESGEALFDTFAERGLISTDSRDVHISGIIDLAFKEAEGWVIVDFKTGERREIEDLTEKKDIKSGDFYERQLEIYKLAWSELSGEKCKEKFIYWLES